MKLRSKPELRGMKLRPKVDFRDMKLSLFDMKLRQIMLWRGTKLRQNIDQKGYKALTQQDSYDIKVLTLDINLISLQSLA